ncbi:MAG: zinc dependent phospholipase C family protein [Chitinophagaceae bacterium]
MRLIARMFIVFSVTMVLTSWGFLVHRTVNQLAIYQLPKAMQPFFYKHMEYIVKHSIRPDQRRNDDPSEAPKHFIDLEPFGDSAAWKMPLQFDKAIEIYSRDTLLKYGYVPYYIMIMKENLVNAFKLKNADSILFYAADLAHYIGDAHVPLHTSVNYDGQLTNQKGLHALWETVVPELEIETYDLSSKHKARYLTNPEEAAWQAVRSGFVLLKNVFDLEKKATLQFTGDTKFRMQVRNGREVRYYTTAFAKEYSRLLGASINIQLTQTANLIADYWYTCWLDGGRPDLGELLASSFTKANKKQCKLEYRAFRKNLLIKNNWLIAKKNEGTEGN